MKRLLFSSLLLAITAASLVQAAPTRALSQSTVSQMLPESASNQRSPSTLQQRRLNQLNTNGGSENGAIDLSPAATTDRNVSRQANPQQSLRGRGGAYPTGRGEPSLIQQRRLIHLDRNSS